MKQLILVLITFFCFSSIKAQDNPYEIFGYESKVKYETKISEYFIIKNSDTTSVTKSMAFNLELGYVLFLNEKDSIINKTKIEPNQLLRWLSVDPLASDYPSLSPYNFVANTPINAIDPDGRKILFVNGFWNSYYGGIMGSTKGGKGYWGSGFATEAQSFFNDYSKMGNNNYIDGSSNFGGDMSGQDRFDAGMAYAKANLTVLTADMVEGETFKMVTHSEGGGYGAGIAQYLIDQGYQVETIVHLSTDEGDEFSTPKAPTTYQLGYQGDWVTGNKTIKGVDKSGLVNSGLGWQYVHGQTKYDGSTVFDQVRDLTTVRTQDNIGMVNGKAAAWKTQVQGTTTNGTDFTRINGSGIMNQDGTIKK
jgi:hypothetical protein